MFKKVFMNKKALAAAVAVLALSGVLAACGGKEDASQGQTQLQQQTRVQSQAVTTAAAAESEAADDKGGTAASEVGEPQKNKVFGEFTSKTLDGQDVDQEIFAQADLTMVNLWGTFCGYCIEEMPYLGDLNRQYKDQGFQIVGILTDVTEPEQEDAVEIVETTKADYTHILLSDSIYPSVAGVPVPTTVFLDKEGNPVGEVYAGAKDKATWESLIKDALEQVKN